MIKNLLVLLLIIISIVVVKPANAQEEIMRTQVVEEATTLMADDDSTEPTQKPTRVANTMEAKQVKTTMQNTMTTAREEMQEKMSAAKEAFKTKLETIKDEKKKTTAATIDTRIADMNTKHTTNMSARLERLTQVLSNISTKEAALESEDKSTTAAKTSITVAQAAVDDAMTAVKAQMEKEYVINITTEAALRTAANTTIKQFLADLKAVRAKVVTAQSSVAKAHANVRQLMETEPTTPAE